ncbi:Transketolase C-terminal domain [Paucilactobacillus oligofermentans DSM 15707 = LMG 22743]|uniref:transketolase-like TK C-terminal-containing protein n=1 Tax=Paucilactobacillus oligofermentans TaxID=293371 RepID=UPI00070D955A|nr:transketolase C-terminal domain-containing protein [Paucilactobacillus oligofermentans]CUS26336.1 Transketolase C-terminal domain [Paucilactobacillus oligofermentans DSM 15707 = LMG 22743]
MSRKLGPTTIVLSRQDLPILENSNLLAKEGITKGGYIISKSPENEKTDGLIIATCSEVSLAINAQNELNKIGKYVDVVSMSSQELFNNQSKSYRDSVLPPNLTKRISIEMESTFGWGKYVGLDGVSMGVYKFGMSGSADELISNYGFTVQKVVDTYNSL